MAVIGEVKLPIVHGNMPAVSSGSIKRAVLVRFDFSNRMFTEAMRRLSRTMNMSSAEMDRNIRQIRRIAAANFSHGEKREGKDE